MTWTRHDWAHLTFQAVEYASAHPTGFTKDQLGAALQIEPHVTNGVVYRLRRMLADQNVNLVARPQGKFEPWRYTLVGDLGDAKPWEANRLGDVIARLRTVRAVASSMVNAATPETEYEARQIVRDVGRLIEDVALLESRNYS